MNTEQMKGLVKQFLKDYIKHYDLDLSNKKDEDEFIKAIETLEAIECESFFQEKGISILKYPEFRKIALQEMPNIIKEEKDWLKNLKKMVSIIIYQLNYEILKASEARNLYNAVKNETVADFKKRIETLGVKSTLSEEELVQLRTNVLEVMEAMHPSVVKPLDELSVISGNDNTQIIKSLDYKNVERLVDQIIDQIPEDVISKDNYQELLNEMLKSLENYLIKHKVNKLIIEEAKHNFDEKLTQKIQRKEALKYYQKVVEVFNSFNYDRLTEEEKLNLLLNIKNDNFLTPEKEQELNISAEEHKKIQKDLMAKLGELLIHADKEIYDKYIKLLQEADASYYEKLQSHLTIEEIRLNNPNAKYLSDDEILALIKEIKKAGIEITIAKIMEMEEVKAFTDKFYQKASEATLDQFETLEKELSDFQNSKQMLGLTNFNKMLLVSKLRADLKDYKWAAELEAKTGNIKKEWDNKIYQMKDEELMPFYHKLDQMTAEELGLKDVTDEELNVLKSELKGYVLDEITNRLLADLDMKNASDLDKLKEKIANLKPEDFDKYKVPEELQEEIKNRAQEKIEAEKINRKKAEENVDKYLKIGTEVVLTKEVSIYDDEYSYFDNKPLNNKKVKANKKGMIDGYVVQKGDDVLDLRSAVDLKRYLADGYDVIGYKFAYKKFFTPTFTYVKPDEVKVLEQEKLSVLEKMKKHWKKIAITAALVVGAATAAIFGLSRKSHQDDSPKNDYKIENTVTPNNAEKDLIQEKSKLESENISYVDETGKTLDEEVIETLNAMPGSNSTFEIDHEARIFSNADELGVTNGQRSYHNARGDYDIDRKADGFVLEDENGNRKVCNDITTVYDLIANQNYHYLGTRILNKYSKNDQDYEGLFQEKDIVLFEESQTILNELEAEGKVRRLTK